MKLSYKDKNRIKYKRTEGAARGRKIAAKIKKEKKRENILMNKKKGEDRVGKINERDRYIAGLMLYKGEGAKTDGSVYIANSDPSVIVFMLEWFKEFFDKKPSDFRAYLYIHDNLDEAKAIDFWSETTKIPKGSFGKSYIVKNNPDRLRKVKHEFGVLRIGISNCDIHREIMGSMDKIMKN